MDFIKRIGEMITQSDERAAIKERQEREQDFKLQETDTTIATTPSATPVSLGAVSTTTELSPASLEETRGADITTMKAATVDTIARAPLIDETIIKEKRESKYLVYAAFNH